MIPVPTGVRVWLATGHTDMRRGFPSLSLQVQEVLRRDPLSGHLFCFRGRCESASPLELADISVKQPPPIAASRSNLQTGGACGSGQAPIWAR